MKHLFFDIETSDFQKTLPDGSERARIVQIAFINELQEETSYLIKPDGWEIAQRCTDIHGITNEIATNDGWDIKSVLENFDDELNNSDILIAHNIDFDFKMLLSEYVRNGLDTSKLESIQKFCTMKETTEFVGLLNQYGKPKWPKLSELHQKLFGSDFDGAHDAYEDVRALERCYMELKRIGQLA